MKTSTKIALFTAVACIGAGGVLCLSSFASARAVEKTKFSQTTVTESFTRISVDVGAGDIYLKKSTDGTCYAEIWDTENYRIQLSVEENTLRVDCVDGRKWYEYTLMNFWERKCVVYLPDVVYQSVSVQTRSGDIDVKDCAFINAEMQTNSGEIEGRNLTVTENFSAQTDSGDIALRGTTVGGALSMQTDSGEIEAEDARCNSLALQTGSGEVDLEKVLSEGDTKISTRSGDVRLTACDGANFDVQTKSGNVRGSVRTKKIFLAHSKSGKEQVPTFTEGGTFKITTSSGDIRLTVLEKG